MTNNSIIYSKEGVAAITDSLGSDDSTKDSGYQKIFEINNNLVLICGDGDILISVLQEAELKNKKHPQEIAQEFNKKYFELFATHNKKGTFTICGFDKNMGYRIFKTILPERKVPKEIYSKYDNDGCGSTFVNLALERDEKKGIYPLSERLEDLAFYVFDRGLSAQKSSGVDDVYQFGFIKEKKAILLLDNRAFCRNNTVSKEVNDLAFRLLKSNLEQRYYLEKVFNYNNTIDFFEIDPAKKFLYSPELNSNLRKATKKIIDLAFRNDLEKLVEFKETEFSSLDNEVIEIYNMNKR